MQGRPGGRSARGMPAFAGAGLLPGLLPPRALAPTRRLLWLDVCEVLSPSAGSAAATGAASAAAAIVASAAALMCGLDCACLVAAGRRRRRGQRPGLVASALAAHDSAGPATDPEVIEVAGARPGEAGEPLEAARARLERELAEATDGNCLLLCAACGATVAALRYCEGSSRHFNPHGYLFHIGRFSRAGGAVPAGPPATLEDTWFPGWAWRLGICRACGAHVGWRYERQGSTPFWGLVWSRLVKARRPTHREAWP